MEALSVLEHVRKELRKDMNDKADFLAGGGAQSFEQYQHVCGVIQGLALAERHILDLAERLKRDDDN